MLIYLQSHSNKNIVEELNLMELYPNQTSHLSEIWQKNQFPSRQFSVSSLACYLAYATHKHTKTICCEGYALFWLVSESKKKKSAHPLSVYNFHNCVRLFFGLENVWGKVHEFWWKLCGTSASLIARWWMRSPYIICCISIGNFENVALMFRSHCSTRVCWPETRITSLLPIGKLDGNFSFISWLHPNISRHCYTFDLKYLSDRNQHI